MEEMRIKVWKRIEDELKADYETIADDVTRGIYSKVDGMCELTTSVSCYCEFAKGVRFAGAITSEDLHAIITSICDTQKMYIDRINAL